MPDMYKDYQCRSEKTCKQVLLMIYERIFNSIYTGGINLSCGLSVNTVLFKNLHVHIMQIIKIVFTSYIHKTV